MIILESLCYFSWQNKQQQVKMDPEKLYELIFASVSDSHSLNTDPDILLNPDPNMLLNPDPGCCWSRIRIQTKVFNDKGN